MIITLTNEYLASADDTLLGYVGEHRSRRIIFQGLEVEGADGYRLRVEYKSGISYEVDITSGEYLIDGSILRAAQRVSAQIYAVKTNAEGYELVKKSQIFELEIKPALDGEPAPIPTYEAAKEYLDKIIDYIDGGGGGGGGDGNYNSLTNKPKINGETLVGDKTFEDLGFETITSAELAAMWEG